MPRSRRTIRPPVVTLLLAAACAHASNTATSALSPVDVAHFGEASYSLRFSSRRDAGDTVGRTLAIVERREHATSRDSMVQMVFVYPAPYRVEDSLVMRRDGLRPVFERLRIADTVSEIRYDGRRVAWTITRPGIAPVRSSAELREAPYAFNAMEAIARSLPWRAGYSVVVPLFSEVDRRVEHDTLTVIGRASQADGSAEWRVRFADPVLTMELCIDEATRRLVCQEIRLRASGRLMRYERVAG